MSNEYTEIKVGSNSFKNTKFLFKIDGVIPLLFEKGKYPLVWLNATNLKEKTEIQVIKNSESLIPAVNIYKTSKDILINYNSKTILETSNNLNKKNILNIIKLDLRPFGLNLFLDNDNLCIGGITFTNNTFETGGIVINVNNDKAEN